MTVEREALITDNVRLAYHIAGKYINTGIEYEELAQLAILGLVKAARVYKPDRGAKYSTLAAKCAINEILMAYRRDIKKIPTESLEIPINEQGNIYYSDVLPDENAKPDEIAELNETNSELYKALNVLPTKKRRIIAMYYGLSGADNKTQQEIADILGITQAHVSRTINTSLRKLRNLLAITG